MGITAPGLVPTRNGPRLSIAHSDSLMLFIVSAKRIKSNLSSSITLMPLRSPQNTEPRGTVTRSTSLPASSSIRLFIRQCDFASARSIPYYDFTDYLRLLPELDGIFNDEDGHYAEKGYELLSQELVKFLRPLVDEIADARAEGGSPGEKALLETRP